MTNFCRRWAFGLALVLSGVATATWASEPVAPHIDLVADVQKARGGTVCFDCGESLISEIGRSIADGSIWSQWYVCGL